MKKLTLLLVLLFFITSIFPEKAKLGESEFRGVKKVKFVNKSSRIAAEVVREQNTETGKKLAEKMAGDAKEASNAGIQIKRYSANEGRLGGDVVILDRNTNFGHINSIARILSAYIQNSFQYEEDDSDILALYILYYNAIHRGDTGYIGEKYTEDLLVSLDPKKTGIDESYQNWPGKTEIVIPIASNILKDKGADVKTEELGDEVNKVIDSKKNGTESKKKFEELQVKKTAQEKKEIIKKEKEVQKKEEQILNKEERINRDLTELKKNPEKNKEQIVKKEIEKKSAAEEKKSIAAEKKAVAEKKKEIAGGGNVEKSPVKAENKTTDSASKEKLKKELVAVKNELAQKKVEEIKKELFDKNVVEGKILFLKTLKYLDKGHYNNELQMLDPVKDDMIFRGDYNNICSNTFAVFGDNVVAIGYANNHSSKHNLVLINQENLKKIGESEISVFWRSPMIIKGDDLYAFEEDGELYYLTRLDKTLKKKVRSGVDISPDSNVTFYGNKIYLTGKQKDTGKMDIVVLNKDDLGFIKKIQP